MKSVPIRQKNATDTERRHHKYIRTKKRARVAFAVPPFKDNRSPATAALALLRGGTPRVPRVTASLDYFLILDALSLPPGYARPESRLPIVARIESRYGR